MTLANELLNQLDKAVNDFQFPTWDIDEDSSSITGAMRVSGFKSSSGIGLIFESIEYTKTENVIQCMARCFATFPIKQWLQCGESIYVPYDDMIDGKTGNFIVDFGVFNVTSRNKKFTIDLDKTKLIDEGYINKGSEILTEKAFLFKLCDTVPKEFLFCEPKFLKKVFELPEDTKILFSLENWEHPSTEIYEEDDVKPSKYRDIKAMVKALSENKTQPDLKGNPNTSWQYQVDNYDE